MLNNVLKNLVRIGRVDSVDVEKRTAKVYFDDKKGGGKELLSDDLKVIINHPLITITKKENGAEWNFKADYASVDRKLGLGETYDKEIPDTITLDRSIDYLCPIHVVDETKNHEHYVEVHPWLPFIGQMVICLMLPNGNGDGFVLGGLS